MRTIVLVLVAVVLLLALVQWYQITAAVNGLKATGAVVQASNGAGAETYEEMMARMHPDQVVQATAPQMVGGC